MGSTAQTFFVFVRQPLDDADAAAAAE